MNRTIAAHTEDAVKLNEALDFFGKEVFPNKPRLEIVADVVEKNRSVYRIQDRDGIYDFGYVTKTQTMWKLETPDHCIFRTKNVDLIAVRIY